MANIVCIGGASTIRRHQSRLKALGYRLHLVGSVDEYLRVTDQLGAQIVFVSESFEASARRSVAHWVRHATPNARIIFLNEHHLEDGVKPDDFVNVADAKELTHALQLLLTREGVCAHLSA